MLGLGKRKKSVTGWQWDIAGKHPAARDFFASGQKSLMAEAFSEWMRRGAEGLVTVSKELLVRSCSWRFWARTPQAGILACGIIRNSCDSVGRPFPLLVMGTGKLEDWEDNWELLPFACEGLWRQMEQLASKNYGAFESLEEDLSMFRPPQSRWQEIHLEKLASAEQNAVSSDFHFRPDQLEQEKAMFLPFQILGHNDFFTMISDAHALLKKEIHTAPNSLFIGGLIDQPGLAVFKRPLSKQDFERMWMPRAE